MLEVEASNFPMRNVFQRCDTDGLELFEYDIPTRELFCCFINKTTE